MCGTKRLNPFFRLCKAGCQIGHFMANFENFGHFLTALAMKKRIWPFCEIWPFFGLPL